MKTRITLLSGLVIFTCAFSQPALADTEREKALEVKVQELEKQLAEANRTIEDLKGELLEAQASEPVEQAPSVAEARPMPEPAATHASAADTGAGTEPGSMTEPGPVSKQLVDSDSSTDPASYGFDAGQSTGTALRVSRVIDTDTPASISRVGWKDLSLGGVEDVSRLQYLVPGLRYGQTGHDVRLGMRGARSNSIGPETSNVVAMYEDGIYTATSTEGQWAFLDVERIDVLRGPQVTNFGQHAYAGAVSIVSNRPSFEGFGGYAELENGLPDKTRWRLTLNAPATDTLAFRFAGVSESRSGWVDNSFVSSDADDLNDRKVQSIRASVLWQPSDEFSLLFWSRYHDENGTASSIWGYQQIGAYEDGELKPGNQFAPGGAYRDFGPWAVSRNFISNASYENWVNTLDLNWDMGFAELRWLANFTSFHGKQFYDTDYSDRGLPRTSTFSGRILDQTGWSNELRMTSHPGERLDWLVGLYFSDRKSDWGWLQSTRGGNERAGWDIDGSYSTDTQAVFGQLSYAFADRWTVTGGLRWNDQGRSMRTGAKDSWDDVLWKAALQWDVSEHSMSYFSASTGYRAGGINTAQGVDPFWEPEKLTAWELGWKAASADGKIQWNVAGWYNDFKDVQSQSFLVLTDPASPEATEYTGNGGSMDARGIEAELQWAPMDQWRIAAQLAYTKAEFNDYVTAGLPGLGDIPGHTGEDGLQYRGWRPAMTPEWVVGLQTSYTFTLKDAGTLTPYLQSSYVSDYYGSDINLAGVRQGSHTRTDFRLIWASPLQHFELQLYYLNIEDDAQLTWTRVYSPSARPDITTLQADWSNPHTYGIIFNYSF